MAKAGSSHKMQNGLMGGGGDMSDHCPRTCYLLSRFDRGSEFVVLAIATSGKNELTRCYENEGYSRD